MQCGQFYKQFMAVTYGCNHDKHGYNVEATIAAYFITVLNYNHLLLIKLNAVANATTNLQR